MFSRAARTIAPAMILVALLSACGSGGGSDFNLISLEEEWRLGQQLSADIARQMKIVNDPQINSYVNAMGQDLVRGTALGNLPWQFHVVEDPSINAFNIPGGHVYVTTGLIAAADNASELAGVMGHEIAHGVERHGTEQLTKNYGLSIIAGLLLGQNPAVYQQILAQIVGGGVLARFSREAEEEADTLGVRYMTAAGWNPRGMVTMFEELLENSKGSPGRVESFFATHPLTQDRIRAVSKQIQGLDTANLRSDDSTFQTIRRRVAA
jgi:predicted Zn-dependent protease